MTRAQIYCFLDDGGHTMTGMIHACCMLASMTYKRAVYRLSMFVL